jgi:hypothetical protein
MSSFIWNALRPLAEMAVTYDPAIKGIVFLLALGMLALSVLAYKKTHARNFMFISLAFLFFAVKWGLKVIDVFFSPGTFFTDSSENVFELLIFASLFLAVFRK